MNLHEEVYTSAAELLDRSSANLGIVARTREFPLDLESELESYRAYSVLPELRGKAPDRHPPRFILGPCRSAQDLYGVTRVCYAGTDHTGRTTPLAHHVLVSRTAMKTEEAAPWMVVNSLETMLYTQWQQPAAWIDPPRTLNGSMQVKRGAFRSFDPAAVPESHKRALIAAVDAFVQFPSHRRPVVFVLPKDRADASLGLVIDVLQLLPESLQLQLLAVTHVVETSDYVRDAWLMVTYSDTPFYERCRGRRDAERPIIIDFFSETSSDTGELGAIGKIFARRWVSSDPKYVLSAVKVWEQVGIPASNVAVLDQVIELKLQFKQFPGGEALSKLAERFTKIRPYVEHPQELTDWTTALLTSRVRSLPDEQRADALAAFFMDRRWPEQTRNLAWNEVVANPNRVVPRLFAYVEPNTSEEESLKRSLQQLATAKPDLITAVLAAAATTGTATELRAADALLTCGCVPLNVLIAEGCRLFAAGRSADDRLTPGLIKAIGAQTTTVQDIEALCRGTLQHDRWPWTFWMQAAFPGILKRLSFLSPQETDWVAARLTDVGLQTSTIVPDLQTLIGRHGPRLSAAAIDYWLRQTAPTAFGPAVQSVLQQTGLYTIPLAECELANGGPVNTARVGRPPRRDIGPVRLLRYLSIVLLVLVAIVKILSLEFQLLPSGPTGKYWLLVLGSVLGVIWVIEAGIWMLVKNVSWFSTVALIRRMCVLVLGLSIVLVLCLVLYATVLSRLPR